jgi:hypothetical protein
MDARLMSLIDRVNRYFLDGLAKRQRRGAPASPALLPLSPAVVGQLARLDLVSHDEYVGETLMLWGMLVDGTPTAISETDPGWVAVLEALDQSGRLTMALHLAQLQLLADPDRRPLRLLGDPTSLFTK